MKYAGFLTAQISYQDAFIEYVMLIFTNKIAFTSFELIQCQITSLPLNWTKNNICKSFVAITFSLLCGRLATCQLLVRLVSVNSNGYNNRQPECKFKALAVRINGINFQEPIKHLHTG